MVGSMPHNFLHCGEVLSTLEVSCFRAFIIVCLIADLLSGSVFRNSGGSLLVGLSASPFAAFLACLSASSFPLTSWWPTDGDVNVAELLFGARHLFVEDVG